MSDDTTILPPTTEPPTQPGWYRTRDSNNWLLYSLDELGGWHAHAINGDSTPCDWGYIDQAGPIDLVAGYGAPTTVSEPNVTDEQHTALVDIGNQVEDILRTSTIPIVGFVTIAGFGGVDYRSPYPREVLKSALAAAAEAL